MIRFSPRIRPSHESRGTGPLGTLGTSGVLEATDNQSAIEFYHPVPKIPLMGSLSLRLIMSFVALFWIALAIITLIISFTLKIYLTNEVDKSLISSGQIIANQTVDQLVNGSEVQVLPSDFFLYVHFTGRDGVQVSSPDITRSSGTPRNAEQLSQTIINEPITVLGTEKDINWRVINVTLADQVTDRPVGSVLIALPLASVSYTVTNLAQVMLALGALMSIVGAILAYWMVQRTLRGVRTIESVAHRVAAGDLSSRVPSRHPNTEVGALAESINIMLSNIEDAFALQQASEQRMRQFVSDASHELRTPLATVRGYAELYRMGGVPQNQIDHAFERIESEGNRMGNLVEDLLKLARLDEKRDLTFTQVDLTESALNAIEDYHVRAPEREAHVIALDGSRPNSVKVMADQDKVTQVITNLLTNVLTHTPTNAAVEIAVGVDPSNPTQAIVEVRDHGPGIKKADQTRIFERFYRTDSSRSRDTGGTGLGLSIVAATLEAHGGVARAYETPGGGLTVRLTFPHVVQNSTTRETQAQPQDPSEKPSSDPA